MPIPNIPLANPRHLFVDENNIGLDNGRVSIFDAGTNDLKKIYADKTQDIEITNPVILDVGGFIPSSLVWIPEGRYDMLVQKYVGTNPETGAPEYEDAYPLIQDLAGAGSLGGSGGGSIAFIESVDELRALTAGVADLVYLAGYYQNDGVGAKFFHWDELANDVDDGGSVISPNGSPATGRWIANFATNIITMQDFGVREGYEYSNASQVEKMILFAQSNLGYVIDLNMGEVYLNGNVDFSGDISVIVREGCRFRGTSGTHTLTFSCQNLTIEGYENLVEFQPLNRLTLAITSEIIVDPRWWGAPTGGVTNSTIWFNECLSNSGSNPIIIASSFLVNPVDFTGRKLIQSNGGYVSVGGLGITTFDEIEAEEEFIFGDYFYCRFLQKTIKGELFNFQGVINNSLWDDFIVCLTSNGPKTVTWGLGNYEFTSSYTPSSNALNKITFDISEGVLFKATGALVDVVMPKVISRTYCFDYNSTGVFSFRSIPLTNKVYLSQFGAIGGTSENISEAISLAIKSKAIVDLGGDEFQLDSELDLSNLANLISIKNGSFVASSSYSGTTLIKINKTTYFENVDFYTDSTYSVYQNGSGVTTKFNKCFFSGVSDHFYEIGIMNSVFIYDSTFELGFLALRTRVDSAIVRGCSFNNTLSIIIDPDNIVFDNNVFNFNYATDMISLSIPLGQTDQRNGISIINNIVNGISRNSFVGLSDPNGKYGSNYHISVENNIGTDVSTTYEFFDDIDLDEYASGVSGYIDISEKINWASMQSGGFFYLTQFNYSLGNSSNNNYITKVRSGYFDSGDTNATVVFLTPTPSTGIQRIYCSFRRSL